MKDLVARLIAYLFVGSFCVAGPVCLVIAIGSAGQRAALIYSGLRAEGTVVAKQSTGSGHHATYAPVFQFTASDGHAYVVGSDVYGQESAFRQGQRVPVLYHQGHPEAARIDAFGQLWTLPLVVGVVGAAFSVIPALVLRQWLRRRRTAGVEPVNTEPAQGISDTGSRAPHRVLGVLLTGGGLVLLAAGVGVVASDSGSLHDSRVLVTSLGVLLAASGLAVGQWVAAGSRLYHALGGLVVTSMAVMFGWIALYGDSAGFSSSGGIGGATVTSRGGSATPARIAFGLAAVGLGLLSLWAWKQVLRPRE